MNNGEHLSKQYDHELEDLRSRILRMGGMVEAQLNLAVASYDEPNDHLAEEAIDSDRRVNEEEVELDRVVVEMIVRRQPTARDLRLIIGVARTVTELERIGDEATKIARAAKWLLDKQRSVRSPRLRDIYESAKSATSMVRGALDAFARMDAAKAATIAQYLKFADGCIVGSDLKRDGYTWNEVDPERVKRFIDAARSA